MANEAVLIFELEPPIPFTCDNTVGIEKGAVLKMSSPMTAALSDGDDDLVAGIAAEEKIANDGKTKIAVYRRGIFLMQTGSAGISVGLAVGTEADESNHIHLCSAGHDNMLGEALETAGDNLSVLVELKIMNRDEA